MANTVARETLSAEAAKKLIAAAEKKAQELKKAMVIAICDESGNLKAFSRMDNAPLISVQIAQDKAWSAISFGIPTHQWFEFIKGDPTAAGWHRAHTAASRVWRRLSHQYQRTGRRWDRRQRRTLHGRHAGRRSRYQSTVTEASIRGHRISIAHFPIAIYSSAPILPSPLSPGAVPFFWRALFFPIPDSS